MITRFLAQLSVISLLGLSGTAQASLEGRDLDGNLATFEAYYDTDLNITWLATPPSGVSMTWADANNLVASLSFTDGVNVYSNWRLPTSDTCLGFNCSGSEMGHLFYGELGGVANQPISTSADPDLSKFINLRDAYYWSSTDYGAGQAWSFNFRDGRQDIYSYDLPGFYALAVSDGDVGAIPEPSAWAMLMTGLGLVGLVVRRRKLAEA